MSVTNIKTAIKDKLDALVQTEDLAGATVTDFKTDPLSVDIKSYPHAFLMPPSMESSASDNHTNLRTYSFPIMVLFKGENISGTEVVEETIETILDAFDNDPTLGGTALGGIEPVSSAPQPFQHQSKALIMVIIEITARQPVSLSFA